MNVEENLVGIQLEVMLIVLFAACIIRVGMAITKNIVDIGTEKIS